jgi:hypothetical protein
MRRAIMAALLALCVLGWPAQAQLSPADPTASPAPLPVERVLIDGAFLAIPPLETAPCMQIAPGTLTVQVQLITAPLPVRSTTLLFRGYRGEDIPAAFDLIVNQQPSVITVPLAGALYCWSIQVDAPISAGDSMSVRSNYAQLVWLRMALFSQ